MRTAKAQISLRFRALWPRCYTTFFMLNSTEHEISLGHRNKNTKKLKLFSCSTQLSLLVSWKKFQNFVSILRFIDKTKFMLSWVEHEKSFITSGPHQGIRCPLSESLDTIECFNGKQTPGWGVAHAQDDVNPHILRMLKDVFRLARPIYDMYSFLRSFDSISPITSTWRKKKNLHVISVISEKIHQKFNISIVLGLMDHRL